MEEAAYLAAYKPDDFPRAAVAVDLVLASVVEGRLCALLQQRGAHPAKGLWALPGSFVGPDETLDQAAARVLAAKAHLATPWLEQLYTFGDPARDPRMRVVSVAYFALVPADQLLAAAGRDPALALATIALPDQVAATASDALGHALPLAFDHAQILAHAVIRLRGKLDYAPIALALLPPLFTLRALQQVYEAILDTRLAKPAFRRRMIDRRWIEPTGQFETGTAFRPAELYHPKPQEK